MNTSETEKTLNRVKEYLKNNYNWRFYPERKVELSLDDVAKMFDGWLPPLEGEREPTKEQITERANFLAESTSWCDSFSYSEGAIWALLQKASPSLLPTDEQIKNKIEESSIEIFNDYENDKIVKIRYETFYSILSPQVVRKPEVTVEKIMELFYANITAEGSVYNGEPEGHICGQSDFESALIELLSPPVAEEGKEDKNS